MSKNVDTSYSRPKFYPDQMIDYKDFNLLAGQTDLALENHNRNLIAGGGILLTRDEGLKVSVLSGMTLKIEKGAALLPDGRWARLSKSQLIDITEFFQLDSLESEIPTLFVGLQVQLTGKNPSTDNDDPRIAGFTQESFEAKISVSPENLSNDSLELARIYLNPQTRQLRLLTDEEEWKAEEIPGTVDLRYRRNISSLGTQSFSSKEWIRFRKDLSQFRRTLHFLGGFFFVKDISEIKQLFLMLETSLLELPLPSMKIGFLTQTAATTLKNFLEHITLKTGSLAAQTYRKDLLQKITDLSPLCRNQVFPSVNDLPLLCEYLENFSKWSKNILKCEQIDQRIDEALADRHDRFLSFDSTLSIGETLLHRVAQLSTANNEHEKQIQLSVENHQIRKLNKRYRDGIALSEHAHTFEKGSVSMMFDVENVTLPVFIFLRATRPRKKCKIAFYLNGKHLQTLKESENIFCDTWENFSWRVPQGFLTLQNNHFLIRVDESAGFGFSVLHIYQPLTVPHTTTPIPTEHWVLLPTLESVS